MKRSELLEELTEDIITYVMHGNFPEQEIASDIKPRELDDRFEDYQKLMDLHFILKDEVVEFVEKLPERLRGVKTQTRNISRKKRGTIDGRINWEATIKERYSGNPQDTALFICDNRSEHYDIDENIVLKKLISIIYHTLKECEEYLIRDYEWVNENWEQELIEEMQRIFERNVHIKRIKEPEEYEPTDRMITTAENSRQQVYREAAKLIDTRKDILEGDSSEIREMLDETAITPDDDETLFELFVLFKYISTIEDLQGDNFRLKTISSGKQEVARIEGEKDVVLYHDSSASDRDLSFYPEALKKDDEELTRTEKVHKEAHDILENYFIEREFNKQTGRPDVIVLEIIDEEKNEYDYLITEVKNSTNEETIQQGIKETLEYLAFLRVDEDLVFGTETDNNYFGPDWNGVLVIQDLEDQETRDIQDQETINILQAKELETELPRVLQKII